MNMLVADSGSTKTAWGYVNANEKSAIIQTDGLNPYYNTPDEIQQVLTSQLKPQLPTDSIEAIFFYGTGCTGGSVNERVAQAIRQVFRQTQTLYVESDMLGAARATLGHEAGIACILGTGANAGCYDGYTLTRGIQSLGFWLGDEGSGGYLGKTLVRDYFQNRLPDELAAAFRQTYNLDRATLLENAYRKPFPNRYFAAFTPFLSAHQQHPYIVQLVENAFSLFLTTYVCPFPESAYQPVSFVGSIAYYFADALQAVVEQNSLKMGHILASPIAGLTEFHQKG